MQVTLENNVLYCGDMQEILPLIGNVDLVLADPPYGTTKNSWDVIIPLDDMWKAVSHVSTERTPVVLTAQAPFDKIVAASNLKQFKYDWIWKKTHPTGHMNAKKMPLKAHENALVFYDKLPVYNPQKTTGHQRKSARAERFRLQSENYGSQSGTTEYDSTERYPISVITFASDKQTSNLHPTQKPVALMEYLINTYTNEGDTVLDFCMGSGTTGVACIRTGRKFIGIEKTRQFFEIAQQRLQLELDNDDLFRPRTTAAI